MTTPLLPEVVPNIDAETVDIQKYERRLQIKNRVAQINGPGDGP